MLPDPRCVRCGKRIPESRVAHAIETKSPPTFCSKACRIKERNARMYRYRKVRIQTHKEYLCSIAQHPTPPANADDP